MTRVHPFAGNTFDRLAERRKDTEWLRQQLACDDLRILPVWRGKVLIESMDEMPRLAEITRASFISAELNHDELILLGEFNNQLFFALPLPDDVEPALTSAAQFHDLRAVSGLLQRDELSLLGYARALVHWRSTHQFCGKCGSRNLPQHAGHVMACSNTDCGKHSFPRLDPAVIVLITDGERVLLGRQSRFPPGRYSTIAGFVEWAESIEEAVIREAHEETGVTVDQVQYHSSQPWPFPSSLMLGFIAHATTTDITLNDGELEDARWFSLHDIASGAVSLPPPQSISFALIEHWYDSKSSRRLRDEPAARIDTPAQLFKS